MFDIVHGSFVWNTEKEMINIERHGVDFTTAARAFKDPKHLIIEDLGHSQTEDRFFCIGNVDSSILTVRFTYREGMIRIFGAGEWRKWRDYYEEKTRS